MKSRIRLRTQVARVASCLALLNFAVPGGAMVSFGVPAKEAMGKLLAERAAHQKDLEARRKKSASRLLTGKEERSMHGRTGENPYLAGQSKWDVVYKGVDLMTGNYSTSATDMSFDGGYGIPVNVTRSYSANNPDEGPFGKGWTLSADVRSTAGGILKSASAPVRSVPVGFKERSASETDPNAELADGAVAQPVEAVMATDAGGDQETVQKDIDGVLTTPPWDLNVNENTHYEFAVGADGKTYQVMTHNETVTPEGTRYVYEKKGTYLNGGAHPWSDSGAAPQPANVTKVVSATDRQGNVTTYSYGSGTFDYVKANGTTRENPLTQVVMPGGHVITLTWGSNPSAASYGRITKVSDGPRTVTYGYAGSPSHGLLASTTTPGGKVTGYGYGAATNTYNNPGSVATQLLTSITSPQGLTTNVAYDTTYAPVLPRGGYTLAPCVVRVTSPNGVADWFRYTVQQTPDGFPGSIFYDGYYWINSEAVTVAGGEVTEMRWVKWGNNGDSGSNALTITTDLVPDVPGGDEINLYEEQSILSDGAQQRNYDLTSQNLVWEKNLTHGDYLDHEEAFEWFRYDDNSANYYTRSTVTVTDHNFMGAPLKVTVSEYPINNSSSPERVAQTSYAYWGADKYFQQKAVQDQAGRYSFTDYYPSSAPAGKRGQTYRVYDPKNGGVGLDASAPIPVQSPPVPTANRWRYQVAPAQGQYSAQFDYDAEGRPTDVWKLQSTTTNPWKYVQTHTSYGGDGSPAWGQASQVVEDYGGINRTTTTQAYTSWGKACDVIDAAGHEFVTDFDPDGQVNAVRRVDGGLNQAVVSYSYGSDGVENGQPTQVTDGLSGVTQTIAYTQSGGGVAQPLSVTETNGSDSYSVAYAYDEMGDRATATYTTPSGTTRWKYSRYAPFGTLTGSSRAFRTLTRLDANGSPTPEEFHYQYDFMGHLTDAAFAQSPYKDNAGQGYVPGLGQAWYDSQHPASSRGRTHYVYDAAGRLLSTATYWDRLIIGSYTYGRPDYQSEALLANGCDYEIGAGLNRGLKTASRFYRQNASDPTQFALERTETYGYDPQLDYLTSANYGDGLQNASPTWSYDAAGNRNDAVCDNLNRATSLGGAAVTNDILGNRISKGGVTYGWDVLNRLTSLSGSTTAAYQYRADGMRVAKQTGGVTTLYRHDGQMGFEDVETSASSTTVTRYGLGARGVDLIERTTSNGTTTGFPIYDAHGNNVATLSRNGSGGYNLSDRRSYDAWGIVRAQQSGGDPKLRYCANLGHKADDESGLIYMRARYYEPSGGRFINEDTDRDGGNWFAYASNRPNMNSDLTGCKPWDSGNALEQDDINMLLGTLAVSSAGAAIAAYGMSRGGPYAPYCKGLLIACTIGAVMAAAVLFAGFGAHGWWYLHGGKEQLEGISALVAQSIEGIGQLAGTGVGALAGAEVSQYMCAIGGALLDIDAGE